MRIDELKKKLEIIGEKYNLYFRVEQELKRIYIGIDNKVIVRIDNEVENILDTTYPAFKQLKEELRTELFDIFIKYAKTPPDEREEEKRFIVPLPGLVTTDGKQQYLTHKEEHFFASRRDKKLRQTWKEKDLIHVPEVYRKYAVEVDDEI